MLSLSQQASFVQITEVGQLLRHQHGHPLLQVEIRSPLLGLQKQPTRSFLKINLSLGKLGHSDLRHRWSFIRVGIGHAVRVKLGKGAPPLLEAIVWLLQKAGHGLDGCKPLHV